MQTKCPIIYFVDQRIHLLSYYLSVCNLFADNCNHTLNFVQKNGHIILLYSVLFVIYSMLSLLLFEMLFECF